MSRKITISPLTRLEGHGEIDIFLDEKGEVQNAYLAVPDFRAFEKFCEGRAAEEMPALTAKICGVCPVAHHMTSTKALDHLFGVQPPPAAKKIRELMYNAFIYEDHLLHFYFLGGPDLLIEPHQPASERNIFGVVKRLGEDAGKAMISIRSRVREINNRIAGSALYPVCGLPGGLSKGLTREDISFIQDVAKDAVEFAKFTLKVFDDFILGNPVAKDFLHNDIYCHRTYYAGLVDEHNKVNFYDGRVRVVDADGKEYAKFDAREYLNHFEEFAFSGEYLKIVYLKKIGWHGFVDGNANGIYRVAPLARFNASDGMATPLAQAEYEKMTAEFGAKPVHHTFAYHWARLIEVLYAAERMVELAAAPELADPHVRNIPENIPKEGIGICEAPRGLLIHHYKTDANGILEKVNLIVGTQNNAAAISLSIQKACRGLIRGADVSEEVFNRVESVFRAYDPCLACATHSFKDEMPIVIRIYDAESRLVRQLKRK